MSLPATVEQSGFNETAGAQRAARLMRVLGPAANAVWAELDPADADRLSRAMSEGSANLPSTEEASAFVDAFRGEAPEAANENSVWSAVEQLQPSAIARSISCEHPQTVALILSRLSADIAARTVRILPRDLATEALTRLMTLGRVHPDALNLIEN